MIKKKVVIQSYLFLSPDAHLGVEQPIGGAIRYLRDLGRLFYEAGFDVHFLQKSNKDFYLSYEDWAHVQGLRVPQGAWSDVIFSYKAYQICKADIVCYGNMEDSFPFIHSNSIAIQHGIWWDYPIPVWKKMVQEFRVKYVAKRVKSVICVDTNFSNWCRTKWPKEEFILKKLYYLPNYADLNIFKCEQVESISGKPKLLFPRRFEYKRGYSVFLEMCKVLGAKGYEFEAVFVGEGSKKDYIEKIVNDIGVPFEIVSADYDSMPKFYKNAFLTFIPTLWSEGTSLAAIESICSGCPVIASDVGGLGNIIVPGITGEICGPSVENFVSVTEKYLKNKALRDALAKKCLLVRDAFDKNKWGVKVLEIINKNFI